MKTKIQTLLIAVLIGMVLISGCLNQTDTGTKPLVNEESKYQKVDVEKDLEKSPEKIHPEELGWCTKENFDLSVFGTAFTSGGTSASWNLK